MSEYVGDRSDRSRSSGRFGRRSTNRIHRELKFNRVRVDNEGSIGSAKAQERPIARLPPDARPCDDIRHSEHDASEKRCEEVRVPADDEHEEERTGHRAQ